MPAKKTAAPAKAPGKALARREDKSGAVALQQAQMDLLKAAGSAGDDLTQEDVALPWLKILQDMNPEVKKREPQYIDGAEPGMFFNTVTKQLWDGEEGILVLVAGYQRSYTEWVPIKQGGGFVKDHGSNRSILDQTTRNEDNMDMLPNGHQVVTSALYYLLIVDPETGEFQPVVFALKGTQLKKARAWNAMMKQLMIPDGQGKKFNPPKFYMAYRLTTLPEQNDKGSWYGLDYKPEISVFELPNGNELAQQAFAFQQMVQQGTARVKIEDVADAEIVDEEDEDEI